jgi:hypothetical protein
MKPTIFILSLPVVLFLGGVFLEQYESHTLQIVHLVLLLLASLLCTVRGFYIVRRSRLLGWLCITIGGIPLILMMVCIVG